MVEGRAAQAGLGFAGVGLVLLTLWHASPLLLWHLRFESQLAAEGDPSRLRALRLEELPAPDPSWPRLVSGIIALRAPLAAEALPACGRCAGPCRLPLANLGTLGIFDEPPPESYDEALDRFAPDPADISLWRTVSRNWKTIDALTDRLRVKGTPPTSFRFVAPGSRGIVTAFRVDGTERYVVYAYADDRSPARVIGVAGLERERFERVLGSLRIEPDEAGRGASCGARAE